MPVEPEPTPKMTNPSAERDGEQHEHPFGMHPQAGEEELLLPLRRLRLLLAPGRRRRCGYGPAASILARAALEVLCASCHCGSSFLASVSGPAVDDRLEHSLRRAAEDDGRGGILDRVVRAPRQRHDGQVGALSGFKGTHLGVESQSPRGVERREPQRVGGEQGVGPPLARPRDDDRGAQLLEHVERRHRGRRVRSEPDRHSGGAQLGQRGDAAAEQGVRPRAVRDGHARARRAGRSRRARGRRSGRRAGRARGPSSRRRRRRACPSAARAGRSAGASGPLPSTSHAFSLALSARCVPTGMPSERHQAYTSTRAGVRRVRARCRSGRARSRSPSARFSPNWRSAAAGSRAKTSR